MKFRLARLGVLLVSVMALVAGVAQPAHSVEAGAIVINGQAAVNNGIAYPCLDGKTTPPTINTGKCLGPFGPNGNVGVAFGGIGAGSIAKVAKNKCGGPPACVEAGTFAIQATGTIRGACGFSTGQLTGTITPLLSVGTKPAKTRTFSVTYTGVGGVLVITGTTNKRETLAGAVVAAPSTGTCANKTSKVFTVAGPIAVVSPCGDPGDPGCP